MPGIVVGVDGSRHSQRSLEWAMKEAALRQVPLTVLAVHPVATSGWTKAGMSFPADQADAERARAAAQEETDKAASHISGQRPPSVTVRAVSGVPAEELINASRDADMLVLGSRGSGGFSRLLMGSVSSQAAHYASCPVVIIPSAPQS
jgi:nucleotide-binding universal stress UspA family protein